MKIVFIVIGKTDETYLETGIVKYIKRLEHYIPFEMKVIPDIKNRKTLTEEQQKKSEGELILSQISSGDDLILLDENGKIFSSSPRRTDGHIWIVRCAEAPRGTA